MKKRHVMNLLLLVFVSLAGCGWTDDLADDSKKGFIVSGVVEEKGNPMSDVNVTIDDNPKMQAVTNSDGRFEIVEVPMGNYKLTGIKTIGSNGTFIARTQIINVSGDLETEPIKLPAPVVLDDPEEVAYDSMTLNWEPYDDGESLDFREYKLYRSKSSGLDETTGDLIHVSTKILDTVFIDKGLLSSEEYFYRVYTMNQFGLLGGSNIVSATTLNFDFFKNGGFEDGKEHWDFSDASVDTENAHSGANSGHIKFQGGHTEEGQYEISQKLDYSKIDHDSIYHLSFWYRYQIGSSTECYFYIYACHSDGFNSFYHEMQTLSGEDLSWSEYEMDIETKDISQSFSIRFSFQCNGEATGDLWIDDVELVRVNN